jgi:hypothetical protein
VPEVVFASWVPTLLDHLVQATGGEARIPLKGLKNERKKRIQPGLSRLADEGGARILKDATDRPVMNAKMSCDGPDGPLLCVIKPQDLCIPMGGVCHDEFSGARMGRPPIPFAGSASF